MTADNSRVRSGYHPFWASAVPGGLFGLFFAGLYALLTWDAGMQIGFFVAIPLLSGGISGASGLLGGWLDGMLLRRGVASEPKRRVISFVIVAFVVFSLFLLFGQEMLPAGPVLPALAWGGIALGLGFGVVVSVADYRAYLVRTRMEALEKENRYLEEISRREAELADVSRSLILTEERSRMAQELHDSISQGLHGIGYGLQALRSRLQAGGTAEDVLQHLETTLRSTQAELRTVIDELQPSAVEEHGLGEACRLCGQWAQEYYPDTRVSLEIDYQGDLLPAQEAAAYRIVQEGLTNVGRHAGPCKAVIALKSCQNGTQLTIADDGRGIDASSAKGRGLRSMEARVRQTGGTHQLRSHAGQGTVIEAWWPHKGEDSDL